MPAELTLQTTGRDGAARRGTPGLGCWGGSPVWALALAVAAVAVSALIQAVPALARATELDRGAVAAGQWWRILSCHLAHWGWAHWACDIGVLIGLCWLAEERVRWVLSACLLAAPAVSLTVILAAFSAAPSQSYLATPMVVSSVTVTAPSC